jgi:dihydroorotase
MPGVEVEGQWKGVAMPALSTSTSAAGRLSQVAGQLRSSSSAGPTRWVVPRYDPTRYDTLIRGGIVVDPANQLENVMDVATKSGLIAAVEPPGTIDPAACDVVYDATGQLVMPGLVDLHAHGFQFFDSIGISFDEACLGRCTTTAVDAGSSGAANFPGFRKYIIDQCKTRVLALLNISLIGAGVPPLDDPSKGGSSDDLVPVGGPYQSAAHCSVPHTVKAIEDHRDVIVGIKIAMSKSTAAAFPGGAEAGEAHFYEAALEASAEAGVPLMCHHTFSTVSLESCPGRLRKGDIYTHTFHGFDSTLCDRRETEGAWKICDAAMRAREGGVVFDIGHGMGSFNWTVAEACMREGLGIDVISTDIWQGTCYGECTQLDSVELSPLPLGSPAHCDFCCPGPCYDLPTVMTKCLALGMDLTSVVRASTITPANTIGWGDRIGTVSRLARCQY